MNEVGLMESSTLNDFCRLCANRDDNMVSIYSDEGADHMLENKIKMHLPFINVLLFILFIDRANFYFKFTN